MQYFFKLSENDDGSEKKEKGAGSRREPAAAAAVQQQFSGLRVVLFVSHISESEIQFAPSLHPGGGRESHLSKSGDGWRRRRPRPL